MNDTRALVRIRRRHIQLVSGTSKVSPHIEAIDASLDTALDTVFQALSRAKVGFDIVIDDEYARIWKVSPPQGTQTFADLLAACRARFSSLFDLNPEEWSIEAEWQLERDFIACALPASLVRTIETGIRRHKLYWRVGVCTPYSIYEWNRYCEQSPIPQGPAGIVCRYDQSQGGLFTLIGCQQSGDLMVRSFRLDDLDSRSHDTFAKLIRTHCLQSGAAMPERIRLLGDIDELEQGWANLQSEQALSTSAEAA